MNEASVKQVARSLALDGIARPLGTDHTAEHSTRHDRPLIEETRRTALDGRVERPPPTVPTHRLTLTDRISRASTSPSAAPSPRAREPPTRVPLPGRRRRALSDHLPAR